MMVNLTGIKYIDWLLDGATLTIILWLFKITGVKVWSRLKRIDYNHLLFILLIVVLVPLIILPGGRKELAKLFAAMTLAELVIEVLPLVTPYLAHRTKRQFAKVGRSYPSPNS